MKSEKIVRAYARMEPNDEKKEQIFQRVIRKSAVSAEREGGGVSKKKKAGYRAALTAVTVIAILSALAVGGYAAVKKWSLPDPELKPEGNDGFGNYEIHQSTTYGEEALTSEEEPAETEENEELTDIWFIREAVKVLAAVGIEDLPTDEMTVTRQNDLMYDREEAEVGFKDEGIGTTVTFHAETGALLNISSIENFDLAPLAAVTSDEEAEACARGYMEKLPVPQDFKLNYIEKYDACFWSLDFSHEVAPGVYNTYETVRIAINTQTGRIQSLVVFSFPLIDDHDENDTPLTEEEAIAIGAKAVFGDNAWEEEYAAEAETGIALPNWLFTDKWDINARYAENTRYAWMIEFENNESNFADIIWVWVDLYTGEVLGGDMT